MRIQDWRGHRPGLQEEPTRVRKQVSVISVITLHFSVESPDKFIGNGLGGLAF